MNKPSEVLTADQFSKVLEASRLLSAPQWREFCAVAHADAKSAARYLLKKGWLTTWQAGQLLGGFHRLLVGNYRLLKEVGRGRWGRVYHAEHRRLGRQVAIKLLAPHLSVQEHLVQRFLAGIRLLAALEHRNLIEIYDAASDGDRLYVVMEYVAGTDLRQHVQRHGPLSLHRAADVAYQTARTLEHLHLRGVLHGEIRPSSLMSTPSGLVKLLLSPGLLMAKGDQQQPGFSDVNAGTSVSGSTAAINAAGTLSHTSTDPLGGEVGAQYCAPEQRDGRPVDVRADVYALGRTLHFLVSGRSLPTPSADSPVSLSTLLPDVPRAFAAICAQMMAEEPENRFATMRDVMAALRSWRSEECAPTPATTAVADRPLSDAAGNGTDSGNRYELPMPGIVPRSDGPLPGGRRDPRRHRVRRRWPLKSPMAVGMAAALATALLIAALWFWIAAQNN